MKKAVMYGAGNIGRGFIAQLFCMSGYETVFIDVNEAVVNGLNSGGTYPIYITAENSYDVYHVTNIRAVNGKDISDVAAQIASADIMATAVGANILKFIAEPIAQGIRQRRQQSGKPLDIIICENLMDADKYLRSLVAPYLDGDELEYFNSAIGTAEASVGRMVPGASEEMKKQNPLAVAVEPYMILPVDRHALVTDVSDIGNITPFAPFDFHIKRKLYMHNMSHAVCAYMGYQKGYTYIWEASADYEIRYAALGALLESGAALAREYGVDFYELECFSYELLSRFDNRLLGDTIARVGRDTIRKLAPSDRISGAISNCLKNGIQPKFIIDSIACALKFHPADDLASVEVYEYTGANGVKAALEKYCGICDADIAACVERNYNILQ